MKQKINIFIIIFSFLFLLHCSSDKPDDISPGKEPCEYCKMKITDIRFNAQAITTKGRHYHFDSIECLLAWSSESELKKRWVKDYSSREWIELEKAILFQSKELKSPMGAGFSAYHSSEELEKVKKEYSGNEISLEEALLYLKKEWKHKTNK